MSLPHPAVLIETIRRQPKGQSCYLQVETLKVLYNSVSPAFLIQGPVMKEFFTNGPKN
jgi:hypothetical protein